MLNIHTLNSNILRTHTQINFLQSSITPPSKYSSVPNTVTPSPFVNLRMSNSRDIVPNTESPVLRNAGIHTSSITDKFKHKPLYHKPVGSSIISMLSKMCYSNQLGSSLIETVPSNSKKKSIPLGISDFQDLIEEDYIIVDKSLFIRSFIKDKSSKAIVITRPRRFGKTLNLSMLNYFLNDKYKGDSTELFKDLKICEDKEIMKLRGSSPVIMLSLKDISGNNYIELLQSMAEKMFELYENFEDLGKSDSTQEEYNYIKTSLKQASRKISTTLPGKEADIDIDLLTVLKSSLKNLIKIIYKNKGKKPYVLIDEYDSFASNTRDTSSESFKDCTDFFKMFLGSVLKDNPYLEKGLMAGIMPLALAENSAGANNAEVYTVLDKGYENCFGFTEEEVKWSYKEYYREDLSEEHALAVKHWYNGYNFSGISGMYNPVSIMKYISTQNIRSYWNQTSYSDRFEEMVQNNIEIQETLKKLISFDENNNRITVDYGHDVNLVYKALDNNPDGFLTLLLHHGLLTKYSDIGEDNYKLVIPNNEVYKSIINFQKLFLTGKTIKILKELLLSVNDGNPDLFCNSFYRCLQETSYHVVDASIQEYGYELYMMGILSMNLPSIGYNVSQQESLNKGRPDLVIRSALSNSATWIIELKAPREKAKRETEEDFLNRSAEAGMAQIDGQEYYTAGIKSNANVIFKVSISYFKKSVSYTYIKLEKKNKTLMSSTLADYKEVDSKGSTYLSGVMSQDVKEGVGPYTSAILDERTVDGKVSPSAPTA